MHNCYSINIVNMTLTNMQMRSKYVHDLWNKEKEKKKKGPNISLDGLPVGQYHWNSSNMLYRDN